MDSPSDLEQHLARHGSALRQLAQELLRDPHAADDAVQEVWVAALREPPQHSASIGGWLRTVLLHVVSRFRRSAERRERHEAAAAPQDHAADHAPAFEREEMARRLLMAVTSLPTPYRDVVWQRFFEGRTPQEIAERTGEPLATVKSRLQRGVGSLREQFGEGVEGDWRPALAVAFGLGEAVLPATAGSAVAATTVQTAASVGPALAGGPGWMAAAAMVAAVGGVAWFLGGGCPAPSTGPVGSLVEPAVATGPSQEGGPAVVELRREEVASLADGSADAPSPAAAPRALPGEPRAVEEAWSVRGVLVDAASGEPLAAATVRLSEREGKRALAEVVSGPDGGFAIRASMNGAAEVRLASAEHVHRVWLGELDSARRPLDLGRVALRRGRMVRGRLVDETGKALVGQPVTADYALEVRGGLHEVRADARTDAEGAFVLSTPVPVGLVHWRAGFGRAQVPTPGESVVEADGPTSFELRLSTPATIRGSVVDRSGRPLAGIGILEPGASTTVRTGANGRFELPRSARSGSSATRLVVQDALRHRAHPPLRAVPWGSDDLRIVLDELPPFRIVVVDEQGAAVENFAIAVQRRGASPMKWGRPLSRARHPGGVLTFVGIEPGITSVRVLPTSAALSPSERIEVPATSDGTLRVVLARRLPLLVQVLDGEHGVANVQVELIREQNGADAALPGKAVETTGQDRTGMAAGVLERIDGGVTDADGRVPLLVDRDLAGCVLRLSAPGRPRSVVRDLHLPPPEHPLLVALPGHSSVVGRVQLRGRAADDLRIEVSGTMKREGSALQVAPDGTFTIDDLQEGPRTFTLARRVLADPRLLGSLLRLETRRVELTAGVQEVVFDLGQVPFARVHGVVQAPAPLPADFAVDLYRERDDGAFERAASSPLDGEGRFACGELVAGTYRVAFRRGAYDPSMLPGLVAERFVVAPHDDLSLTLSHRPQVLELNLLRPDGTPVVGERIQLRCGGALWPALSWQRPLADGRFVLDPAPTLPIELRGSDEGEPWSASVVMPPDRQRFECDVVLPFAPR
jgi:RNA polymerase sigma factor (sigma-70 family)